jgi:hypothetical protein
VTILPHPSVSPLPSFCDDRPPGLPRSLTVIDQCRNIAAWLRSVRPSASQVRREDFVVRELIREDEQAHSAQEVG